MTDITTKMAEALRHIEGAATDQRVQRYEIRAAATEALRLFDEATALPVQDLPPLPEPARVAPVNFTPYYTADQMHDYARAAVAAAPAPAPQWQPIETAPKDGSNVLLLEEWETEPFVGYWWEYRSKWRASTTHYDTDGNACVIDRIYSEGVTHWMPLPAAPEAGQGKEAGSARSVD